MREWDQIEESSVVSVEDFLIFTALGTYFLFVCIGIMTC